MKTADTLSLTHERVDDIPLLLGFMQELNFPDPPGATFWIAPSAQGPVQWLAGYRVVGEFLYVSVEPEKDTMKEPGSPRKVRLGAVFNPSLRTFFQETPACYTSVSTNTSGS